MASLEDEFCSDISDIDEIDEIDIDIDKIKKAEQVYNDFYKEPVSSIAIYLLYVSKANELQHVKTSRCLLAENGLLKREIIISFIKRYQHKCAIKYKLLSLLRYNIDLEPTEINDFLEEDIVFNDSRFITSEKYLNDVIYKETINMFQDLNALYFIFYEEPVNSAHQLTRRVILTTAAQKQQYLQMIWKR
jgi:hypothetical protein